MLEPVVDNRVSPTSPAALAENVARATDGVVTARQLADLGVSRDLVRHRISQRVWTRRHRGVFVIERAVTDPIRTAARAALLAGPSGAVVSHLLAAHLYRLSGLPDRGVPELTAPLSVGRRSTAGLLVHRSAALEAVLVDGLRATPIARTLSDIAPLCSEPQLLSAMDSALRLRYLSSAALEMIGLQRARMPGGPSLSRLAQLADALSESPLESWVRLLLLDGGLPAPELQVSVTHAGRTYRIDLAYGRLRIGIEADGRAVHGLPEAVLNDRWRQNALQAEGWLLLRFTWDDVSRRPLYVVESVRAALQRRVIEA
jgi:very-short-patch-repair endonuclease/uncharacterized protein YjiS (DUF1127 family)